MIPLLRRLAYDFLFNEDRAVLWLRGAIGAFAVGGAAFAADLAEALGTNTKALKVASAVCAFVALGIGKGDRTEAALKKLEGPKS